MENIEEKARDDEDFLINYGSIRTGVPSKAYKDGWDRIFGKSSDRSNPSVDVISNETK